MEQEEEKLKINFIESRKSLKYLSQTYLILYNFGRGDFIFIQEIQGLLNINTNLLINTFNLINKIYMKLKACIR